MIPKRKFIKKQFIALQTNLSQDGINFPITGDLISQLKSQDHKCKSDAVSVLANLQNMDNDFQEQIYSISTLSQLIKILTTQKDTSLIQTTLFAINNICINETSNNPIKKTVIKLFQLKFDQALLILDSTNIYLIKAILILMGNICNFIPKEYRYLLIGIQNTLVQNSEKYIKTAKYYDLVLEFLLKSKYRIDIDKITMAEQKCIQLLKTISQIDKLFRNRALSATILVMMTQGKNKQCIEIFINNFQQFINDIDLQKQYITNFNNKKDQNYDDDQFQDQKQFQQQNYRKQSEQNIMEEQQNKIKHKKFKKNKRKNRSKSKQIQLAENGKQNCKQNNKENQELETPYSMFIDPLEGVQIMMEFIVERFEDEDVEDEDQEQMDEEEEQGDNGEGSKGNFIFNNEIFLQQIKKVLVKVITNFQKFTVMTFIQGQNLIQLLLRLILMMPQNFHTIKNQQQKIPVNNLIILTQAIIIHEFNLQLKNPHQIPEQIWIFNVTTALQIILKYKYIGNRNVYVQLPHLKYHSQNNNGEYIMKINRKLKSAWLTLLQIYSLFYNPQKISETTEIQNRNIGLILKKLIIQIPQIQLQQWRGQAIDTLFDIYSNENYDKIFVQFDFIKILGQVLKVAGQNKIGGGKGKKKNKFINDVITDIQRFIQYKKKNIKL